ncbi:MAG: ROK family protein [Actinomycetota bacterium]
MSGDRRFAGVDVGGTKCLGVVIDEHGEVIAEERRPTPHGPTELVRAIAAVVEALPEAEAVGVGAAGLVTPDGVLRAAPNLVDIQELPIGPLVADRVERAVVVDNDNTCGTYAEWKMGAAAGSENVVFVGLGTGIGGGLVLGGELQRGGHGFAGEIGHMVVQADGVRCVCGRRGCWERYASGSGLARLAQEAATAKLLPRLVRAFGGDVEAVRGEQVTAAARQGDTSALAVIDDYARWVALGIVNLVNVADPEVVVVGGGLAEAADVVLTPIRRWAAELLFSPEQRPHPAINAAQLGERSPAIGAALLARDRDQPSTT